MSIVQNQVLCHGENGFHLKIFRVVLKGIIALFLLKIQQNGLYKKVDLRMFFGSSTLISTSEFDYLITS